MAEDQELFEVRYSIPNEYLVSYGGITRFFKEIVDNQRLMGTKCPKCGKVWCPPRAHCAPCYAETEWVPLSGKGTVMNATYCYYAARRLPLNNYVDIPYILGLVKLDGADTWLYTIIMDKDMILNTIKTGDRVKAVFREKREGKITDFYFVKDEEA